MQLEQYCIIIILCGILDQIAGYISILWGYLLWSNRIFDYFVRMYALVSAICPDENTINGLRVLWTVLVHYLKKKYLSRYTTEEKKNYSNKYGVVETQPHMLHMANIAPNNIHARNKIIV